MPENICIYLYDDIEILDFAGPYEVFSTAARVSARENGVNPFHVFTISESGQRILARGGLRVMPDYGFGNHPAVDVLLVPGGVITMEMKKKTIKTWIANTSLKAQLTASVCTGAFLLAAAGLLDGKQATTHWEDLNDLRVKFPNVKVIDDKRWVVDKNIITSAGISAGLDMSLYLVAKLRGKELAVKTARQMDYIWNDQELL